MYHFFIPIDEFIFNFYLAQKGSRIMIKIIYLFIIALLLTPYFSYSRGIYASQFNKLVSCQSPFILDETLLIGLDEDITIDNDCALFTLTKTFTPSDSILISSNTNNKIIIAGNCNFGNIFFPGANLVFKGNAQLVIMPGVTVIMDNTTIICTENSSIQVL